MARSSRLSPAGIPLHILQRGNNGQPVFRRQRDYQRYLKDLLACSQQYRVAVHAFVLMKNHVHLLVTPGTDNAISGMMQALGRRYVRYFNDNYDRTGSLFEGRYRSCLIDGDQYLLGCYRFIESNPLRNDLVATIEEYPWSSFAANGMNQRDELITPHMDYLALASHRDACAEAYSALFEKPLGERELNDMRVALRGARAYGSLRFKRSIERKLNVRMSPGKPGRPRIHPLEVEETTAPASGDAHKQQSLL